MKQPSPHNAERVSVPADVVFETVRDEIVLLELQEGKYFGLNSIGSRIWELLTESGDPQVIIARLVEEYDVSGDVARRDLQRLLTELLEKKLISVEHEAPGESK
jgi:hypothetical protein